MPIYAYRCSNCGLQQDVMQKISAAPLTICPECGKDTLAKQLTAAGFQLKGSGYYVTDFKNGSKKPEKSDVKPETKPDAAIVPAASTVSAPIASGAA
ncbi:MAG: FmdB family zinc ribbon protein [Gallionella sp.]